MGETLSYKQQRFVVEYVKDFNASAAAKRAGYSERTARSIGCENLTKSYIKAEIEHHISRLDNQFVPTSAKRNTLCGFVYFIREPFGRVKIGKAVDLQKRVGQIQTASSYELELIAAFHCDDAYAYEAEMHKRYADKRVRGEWFELTDEDVQEIKTRYGKGID